MRAATTPSRARSPSRHAPPPLPTFLVIGAMKAGTDSLWHYLGAHPQVHMSDPKEPDFFVAEANWPRGLDWYRSCFEGAPSSTVAVGEASTAYSKHPLHAGVPERIRDTLPHARFVYLVREPVDRIRSQYQHQVLLRLERRPLERAVLEDPAYVDFSRYAMQLERYLRCFPAERLLVLTSESLRADRPAAMDRVLRFLGVDGPLPDADLSLEHHATNASRVPRRGMAAVQALPGYRFLAARAPSGLRAVTARVRTRGLAPETAGVTMSDAVRDELRSRLRPDVQRLRSLLGPSFSGWGWD